MGKSIIIIKLIIIIIKLIIITTIIIKLIITSSYSSDDTEDVVHTTVTAVSIPQGRYTLDILRCRAGNWVLLRGLGEAVQTTATVIARNVEEAAIFRPLEFNTPAVVKLAIEPRKPSELPIMVEALRKVRKSNNNRNNNRNSDYHYHYYHYHYH